MDIDFVVPWVDSTDPEWIAEYRKYRKEEHLEDKARFRNWDIFHYWFRAVENYAPWVHKVFLVTNGKFPDWINPDCPKLVLVKHSDYIDQKYLPTFNSNTIELNMNKIPGLSEHFVYFNDDFYLNAPVTPEYYFRDGLPCDNNEEIAFLEPHYTDNDRFAVDINQFAAVAILNRNFCRYDTIKQSPRRWFGKHLGFKQILWNLFIFRRRTRFEGFRLKHFEQPFLKSVLDEVERKEGEVIRKDCTRFRQDTNILQYFFRYWQLASNRFYPVKRNEGTNISLTAENIDDACNMLREGKLKSISLNDTPYCPDSDFKTLEKKLIEVFEEKLPQKSSFEK